MRHRKNGLKLNMTSSHRTAMFRNMVTSLLKHEKIRTTSTRAKELRGWADHLITLAKRGDLHARRQALSIVREKSVVHKLFEEAAERFGLLAGGYTRVIKIGLRPGDAAPMSLIQLVAEPSKKSERREKTEKKTDATVKATEKASLPPVKEPVEEKVADDKVIQTAPAEAETGSDEKERTTSVPESVEEK
ncbi:MAG: 50S ribosomal protein L17 [Pseudomonadota bacterium]